MATYHKKKKYIDYKSGNLVLAYWDSCWRIAKIRAGNGAQYDARLIDSDQKIVCNAKSVFPINLSTYYLSLMGFKEHKNENGKWVSNGVIDIIDISVQIEGLYGPEDFELGEDEETEPEPDELDPNQLMIENLVIYPAVNRPEPLDHTQNLTYNILFDYDGDWAKMYADQNAARAKRIEQHGPDPYEGLESYEDIIISTHSGYHVLLSNSRQPIYDTFVYKDESRVLEGLIYLHELQNLYTDQLEGHTLFLEDLISFLK